MMRGRRVAAVAVRVPSGGVLLHEEQLDAGLYARPISRWPFVRGVILLGEMLVLGTRMMIFSSLTAHPLRDDDGAPVKLNGMPAEEVTVAPGTIAETAGKLPTGDLRVGIALGFSLLFGIGLFFLLPLAAVGAAHRWLGTGLWSLIVEGLVRLALLIGYLALIGRLPDIQRVFEYHGAEHKTINAYEAGQPLDVAHVRQASRVHTRCGTGFLLIVVVVSIFVFALIGNPALPLRILSRIVLVPVVAAIAYELMRLGAANYRLRGVRWLMAPGLALQGLTTREPDEGEMECAIVALQRVLRRDGVLEVERVV
ncbi:MAG: DUF1385 domain-containing protein [Ktedonobacterales bacterium]|nr:DUF1385 domain-containing protein [Ktedonobacterales bacterium]